MLTDTEARGLLHQAADTIEVGPAAPFAAPRHRPRRQGVLLAAVAAVLALVGGLVVWRANQPAPADHPHVEITVPSVFEYQTAAAVGLLRARGLDPRVVVTSSCTDSGRALGTDPPAGARVRRGGQVVVTAADDSAARCPYLPRVRDRDNAWALIDLATGHGTGPRLAPYVQLGVTGRSSVTVPRGLARSRESWPTCPVGTPGCSGSARDVLARAASATEVVNGEVVTPKLVTGTNPLPWDEGFTGATSVRFLIAFPDDGSFRPPWSVDAYYDAQGRLTGVYLATGSDARDPRPATGPPGVGPDPTGLGNRFLRFAGGESVDLPIDTPVGLYLDGHHVKTIGSAQARHRRAWTICPKLRRCPLSALGAVGTMVFSPGGVQLSRHLRATTPCLTPGSPVADTGGHLVSVLDRGGRGDCAHAYEVQLYANDEGELVAVNLLTPR